MAQLIVRDIDDKTVKALKVRAAHNGRSAEAEHRAILQEVLRPRKRKKSLKDYLLEMPDVGTDADFERPRDMGRRIEL